MTETMDAAFELKAVDAEGVFEGYASIFEAVDDGHDAVLPGAFARSLAEKGPAGIKLLWQHDPSEPVGRIEAIREDSRGLFVRGRLLPELRRAAEALSLMRCGALDGLSIGYRTRRARHDAKSGVRMIEEVDLWEVSLVTFPMQAGARIAAFKAMPHGSIRNFEGFLREAGGFSRSEAKALAAHGFKALARREAGADWAPVLTAIETLTSKIEESLHERS